MIRLRRLRNNETVRNMIRETSVSVNDLVYPVFIKEGTDEKIPVDSMPGIYQYTIDRFPEELDRIQKAGVPAILIFGIPEHKDECGSQAYAEDGITQRAIRQIKEWAPDLLVIADVCLCEYTSHGHCGLVHEGKILNDETLPLLAKMAVSLAKAGADMIAPSDMMDGHIKVLRESLDENGFTDTIWDTVQNLLPDIIRRFAMRRIRHRHLATAVRIRWIRQTEERHSASVRQISTREPTLSW